MPAAPRHGGDRVGHRPDVGVDGEVGPIIGETTAGRQRVEATRPKCLVALGGPPGTVQIDEDHVIAGARPGEKSLRRFEHDRLLQVEPPAGSRDDGLVGVDEGRRAIRQIGAHEAPHRRAPDPEQQRIDRSRAHREGERHQPLVMKDEAGGIEQIHARLLGDLRPGAERAQGAEIARPPVEIDDEDRSAEGLRSAQHPDPRIVAEIIENQAALPLLAIIGDHGGEGRDRLGKTAQRLIPFGCQAVSAPFDPIEPAVDVALQDARGPRHLRRGPQGADPHRPAEGEGARTAQGVLAIGGDERHADRSADIRVADAAGKFVQQAQRPRLRPARPIGHRLLQYLDGLPGEADQHQPQSEPAAQLADLGPLRRERPAASTPLGSRHRQIDPLGQRQPVDALQHQWQVEAQFELDHDRRLVAAPGDEVAASDLALDLVALTFEELLYRRIERRLQVGVIMLWLHAEHY